MSGSSPLGVAIRELLADARGRLEECFGERLIELRLFGSHARNAAGPESDIDVLVLLDRVEDTRERCEAMGLVIDAGLERLLPVEPIVMGSDELDRLRRLETGFARALDEEGDSGLTAENRETNIRAELARAGDCLAAADQLLGLGLFNDAANRLYYTAFHLASAALLGLGVEVGSHRGLTNLFALHLVKPGHLGAEHSRRLAVLQGLRHHADYDRHFELDPGGAAEQLEWVRDFRSAVEAWLAGQGFEVESD